MKRLIDIVVSVTLLTMLAPLLAVLAFVVRLRLGSPVLFRQRRPGFRGAMFTMYKFRTMRDACDASGAPLPDADRLTPFGNLLRRTSADELPELWNVLRGEMSLVGPRPLLPEYLPIYSSEQARRHDVRPGITGWAQVNGRNAIGWPEKLRLDVWYVDHWSVLLDFRILGRTVGRVFSRDGVNQPGHATAEPFRGVQSA